MAKDGDKIYDVISLYKNVYLSVINQMEVLGYPFENNKEKLLTEKLVASFEIIHTDKEIAETVIGYRSRKKIKLPDAIILATAKKMKSDLLTANDLQL
jgi:hypothetical protein